MIETTKQPYELLVRWGEDGSLRAAHVGFALVSTEDGKQIGWTPQPVMPVDVGQGKGFPLADILKQVHVDALTACDAANKECAEHKATIIKHEEAIKARDATIASMKLKMSMK